MAVRGRTVDVRAHVHTYVQVNPSLMLMLRLVLPKGCPGLSATAGWASKISYLSWKKKDHKTSNPPATPPPPIVLEKAPTKKKTTLVAKEEERRSMIVSASWSNSLVILKFSAVARCLTVLVFHMLEPQCHGFDLYACFATLCCRSAAGG